MSFQLRHIAVAGIGATVGLLFGITKQIVEQNRVDEIIIPNATLKEAALDIARGEGRKLRELCKANEAFLAERGINCQDVLAHFKPNGPS